MNRSDKIIVAILAALVCGWFWISRQDAKRLSEWREAHPELFPAETNETFGAISSPEASSILAAPEGAGEGDEVVDSGIADAAIAAAAPAPERTLTVSNSVLDLVFTSRGGAVKGATLRDYDLTLDPADGPVVFDFGASPALALGGIAGLGTDGDFALEEPSPGVVRMTATAADGTRLSRTVAATNGYHLAVTDEFSAAPGSRLPAFSVSLGPIATASGGSSSRAAGPVDGVDVRVRDAQTGKAKSLEQNMTRPLAKNVSRSFSGMFGAAGGGCAAPSVAAGAPLEASETFTPAGASVDWVAVRERFFVEVLTPGLPASSVRTSLRRKAGAAGPLQLESLAADAGWPDSAAAADGRTVRTYSLYLGPRKMDELLREDAETGVGGHFDIMRFGTWSWFCRWLLAMLNGIHRVIPNYGWAIVVLTVIVRLILFPINRKSAQGMRKMSELQPKMKEINERYKNDPQKRQAETMRLYQENHVNPLSSCLPMFIQLPIFIALFTVLRSAVELRYAPFLWISDLSEPENCFRDTLGFGVNFLPIAMAATMTLQSRLTPSAGDPQQQKMMTIMMPVMMLVMCYSFASALGLYWSVSQALAIFGMWYARRGAKSAAPAK